MEGSAPGSKGRPSKVAPYASQVAQWLREAPDLSSAEVLSRVRLAGYRGGKSALYEFVKQLRTPEFGYKRCPRCRVMVRDIAEFCPQCGLGLPSTLPPLSVHGAEAEARTAAAPSTEAIARRQTPREPAIKPYIVIALRDRRELYEYFKRKFHRAATIEVVRDRRVADRRRSAAERPVDRRQRDRRARHAIDAELRAFGFAIVIRD
jgi:hypothetical protein